MAILARPFADFFNASFPSDSFDAFCVELHDVLGAVGAHESFPGLFRIIHGNDEGTVKLYRRGTVGCASFSGLALAALRAAGVFADMLNVVGSSPHRVTTLHATLDVAEHAPLVISRLYRRARKGTFTLSQKAIPPRNVQRVWGPGWPKGVDTGTLYLGKRTSDVWAKVYDKRSQMAALLQKDYGYNSELISWNDPGPLTRYEIALGRHVGCTLRDVADPTAVFWHFARQDLLPCPDGVPAWSPMAEGFELPARSEVLPAQQLKLLLESSGDVSRLLQLASRCGPKGFDYLVSKLRQKADSAARVIGGQANGTALPILQS